MSETTSPKTHSFQTEVKQLLQLMIHSLYSNKEVFLRELISNGSDACDRLRFAALTDAGLMEDGETLGIRVSIDEANKTITIKDNGIGMTEDEVIENIGTIARSGTKQFLQALSGDAANDANLIGQFGVGFYSAFLVAQKVELITRHAGQPDSTGVRWESEGEGEYTINAIDGVERGTTITLHLRDEEEEFSQATDYAALSADILITSPYQLRCSQKIKKRTVSGNQSTVVLRFGREPRARSLKKSTHVFIKR